MGRYRRLVAVLGTLGGLLLIVFTILVLNAARTHDNALLQPPASTPIVGTEMSRFIPAPDGGVLDDPVWLPGDDQLVVSFSPTTSGWQSHLYTLRPDGTAFTRLSLPDDPECKHTSQHFPRVLPDGRLGYLQRCWVSLSPSRRLPEEEVTLMAYDVRTRNAQRLVPYYLPVNANYFDFAPDMHAGIINDGYGLYERLLWLWPDHLERLPLQLERAGRPRWSPDGRTIAVSGVPNALGKRGADRTLLRRELFLLSADGRHLRPLLDGFVDAGLPSWSPDGRWLTVWLDVAEHDQGLWLVEVATGKRHLLLRGDQLSAAAWSSDGRSLVVAVGIFSQFRPEPAGPIGLYFFDLPDLKQIRANTAP